MATARLTSGDVAGLTDRPRLPRLGKIRLGIKKTSASGSEYPSATDYFVCPPEVQEVYGAKPRELDIVFPVGEVTRVAPVAFKKYSQTRGLVCTSDGEIAHRIVDVDKLEKTAEPTQEDFDAALVAPTTKRYDMRTIPCPQKECRFFKDGTCKAVMNLQFMLPRVPGLGVWQLDTSSINSILDVRGGIELTRGISGGRLAGIPLKLRVEPTTAYPEGKKKVVHTLKLFPSVSLEQVREIVALPAERVFLELPEHVGEIEEELYPKSRTQQSAAVEGPAIVDGEVVEHPRAGSSTSERSGSTAEVAGATPAPRSATLPPAPEGAEAAATAATTPAPSAPPTEMTPELATATRIETLLTELGYGDKQKNLWRKAYLGRADKLVELLERQLEQKRRGSK